MASFEKRKNGWRAQVDKKGVRRSKVLATKQEAINWAAAVEAEILAGAQGIYPKKTLLDAIERYRVEVTDAKARRKPQAARADNLRFDKLINEHPELVAKLLVDVKPEDVSAWQLKRLQQVSDTTVRREAQQFRPVWTRAINVWGWAGSSPWKSVKMPQEAPPRTRRAGWREIRLLLRNGGYITGVAPKLAKEQSMWAFLLSMQTAMRSGEVLRMSRSTVDLKTRVYRIDDHKTDGHVGTRFVPLPRRAYKLLMVLDAAAAAAGRDGYFTISDASRDTHFREVRDRLMIKGLTYHDSRASALTWMSKRVDVMTLAKISGHKDIKLLYNTYYRETPAEIAARI